MVVSIVSMAEASFDEPKLVPVASTESQKELIKEGVSLHEKGDYEGAIRKYEEVLAENPANVGAMYELSYTLEAKKDYQKSLETARKGAQYKSQLLDQFYLVIGNDLDDMGQRPQAIAAYREGLSIAPGNFLLHYNLALAYDRERKWDEARRVLKTAVMLNPTHASSQLLLALEFSRSNFRIPSLLAAARFLVLEPNSSRSDEALNILRQALKAGVSAGDQPGRINITLDSSANKEEGDFGAAELVLSMSRAAGSVERNRSKTEAEVQVDQWKVFLDVLTRTQAKGKHSQFVFNYYLPYFSELSKRRLVEPFVYYMLQRTNVAGVADWLSANRSQVDDFLAWSKQYSWPKKNP